MASAIHLFPEHDDFEIGRTRLAKKAVVETDSGWLMFATLALFIGLFAFATGGNQLRLLWYYEEKGAVITGTVTDCHDTNYNNTRGKDSYSVQIHFQYTVAGQRYTGVSDLQGRICHQYEQNTSIRIHYFTDEPSHYSLETPGANWHLAIMVGSIAFGFVFYVMIKNRSEEYKYALLQRKGIILEASITKTGEWDALSRGRRNTHYYADYVFQNPSKQPIHNAIKSNKNYNYPHHIREGDKLDILYVDDNTYCVL